MGGNAIVSVVTRGLSDDSSGPISVEDSIWLRLTRLGDTYDSHDSTEGSRWQLRCLFTLGPSANHRVGLCTQSPIGSGFTAQILSLSISSATVTDVRSGS